MRIFIILIMCFALAGGASARERPRPASSANIEKSDQKGVPGMRKPVAWEKTIMKNTRQASQNKNRVGKYEERFRGGGRNYLLFQTKTGKKPTNNVVRDTLKSYKKTDTNYNARQLNRGEYRTTYDPGNISEYRQYIRHNWSNSSRRPFDVYRPGLGNTFRQLK